MGEDFDVLYEGTIQRYINEELEMQVSETGVEKLHGRFNDLVKHVIRDAEKKARKEDRKRLLIRHIEAALEENLGDRSPEPPELADDIRKLGPIEVGNLAQCIRNGQSVTGII